MNSNTEGFSLGNEIVFIIEDSADGGLKASAIGADVSVEAENFDQLKQNVRKAVADNFKGMEFSKIVLGYILQ